MPAALGCLAPMAATPQDRMAVYDFVASDVATSANYSNATAPGGVFDASTNRTYLARQAWRGNYRYAVMQFYDHVAATFSPTYNAFIDGLIDDDHGVPAMCVDYQGYEHVVGGVHNSPMLHNVTINPNDISAWVGRDTIGTAASNQFYAYPHPHALGNSIYLFMRRQASTGSSTYVLSLLKTTALSGGTATWGANQDLVNFGTYSRFYQGWETAVSDGAGGWDIYISGTFADGDDNYRQNIYLFIYNTITGNIRNIDGSVSVAAASLPVTLTQANASFRVVDQSTPGHYTTSFSMALDAATGRPHILYNDAAAQGGSNDNTTPFTLNHVYWTGTAWTAPVKVAVQKNRYDCCGLSPIAGGGMVAAFALRPSTNLGTRGGDIYTANFNGSSWTVPKFAKAGNTLLNLDSISPVKDARPELRFTFGEIIQPPGLGGTNAGGSAVPTTLGGNNRYYALGDGGLVIPPFTPQAETSAYVARMTVPPSAARIRAIDELISDLKTSGLWAGFIGLYLPACHDAQAATLNLKGSSFPLTPVGSPVWKADQGYSTDGVASYLDTNYTMSSQTGSSGTGANVGTFEFGCWNFLEGQSNNPAMGALGVSGNTGNCQLTLRDTTNTASWETNAATLSSGTAGAQTSAVGHFVTRRHTTTSEQLYYNGASIAANGSTNSTSLPNAKMTCGKVGPTFSAQTFGAIHFGLDLTNGDVGPGVFYNILHRYMMAIGAVAA